MTTMVQDRESETRYVRVTAPRTGGREYIGPKAQSAVPTDVFEEVEKEANRRSRLEGRAVPLSVVWRELILAGYEARAWGGA